MAIQDTRPQHARPTYQQQPQHQGQQHHRQQDAPHYPFKAFAIEQRVREMKAAIEQMARMGLVEIKKPLSAWRAELVAIMDAMAAGTRRDETLRAERKARVDAWIAGIEREALRRDDSEDDEDDDGDCYPNTEDDNIDDDYDQAFERALEAQIDVALDLEAARLLRGSGGGGR